MYRRAAVYSVVVMGDDVKAGHSLRGGGGGRGVGLTTDA